MNAYKVKALQRRGLVVSRLGCVMQDVEPVDLSALPDEWCYTSPHPDRRWISGKQVGEAHVTLLYGLLDNANTIREDVDEVLDGWEPGTISASDFEVFPSPFEDEPYSCIVARLDVTDNLLDAHARLSLLPHVNTYPTYKPHVTLAYVHKDHTGDALAALRERFEVDGILRIHFTPTRLNYGYPPEETP